MVQPEPGAAAWLVRVCGQVRVDRPGSSASTVIGGLQAGAVLIRLAVEHRAVSRDELADLLWGDVVLPDHWPNAVRVVVSKLRRVLMELGPGPEVLSSAGGVVRLDLPGEWETDLERSARLTAQAGQRLPAAAAEAAALAAAARELVAGQVLPELDSDWARRLGQQARRLWAEAARVEVEARLAAGAHAEAARVAQLAVDADPLDEAAHHLLIRSLLADGRHAAAWTAFRRLERELAAELGIEPAESTRALLTDAGRRDRPARRPPATDQVGAELLGRSGELAELGRLWAGVTTSGRAAVAVVGGPSGIGKTRLAKEFADEVRADGGQVLWGTCYVDSGLPYEPIVGALRERLGADRRRSSDPAPGPALTALLGGTAGAPAEERLRRVLAGFTSPAAARSVVFADLRSMVGALTAEPTMWVLDDLQWASPDTMAFLDVLLAGIRAPVLLVVATRELGPGLAGRLAGWQRSVPVGTVDLQPLTPQELAPLVSGLAGTVGRSEETLADLLHRRTGGHPFLVLETVRHAISAGNLGSSDVADGARAWISLRAAALPPELGRLVDLASVMGLRVPVDQLIEISDQEPDTVLDGLEQLAHQGLLVETEDRFDFAHQITQEVIYDRIGGARRARLHRRVAERLEQDPAVNPAVIAHHYLRAGSAVAGRAVGFVVAAAERSLAVGAWGLAEAQLREVEGLATTPDLRAAAEVAMGAALHQQGRGPEAHRTLMSALELAREHRLAPELAAALLRMVGRGGRGASSLLSDSEQIGLLREGLAALRDWPLRGGDRDNLRVRNLQQARLEGEMGWALLFTGSRPEREALALAALRRLPAGPDSPPEVRAQALLNARSVRTGGGELLVRTREIQEVLTLPMGQVSADLVLAARVYLHEDLLRAGDVDAAAAALAEAQAAAGRLASPYWQWAAGTWASLSRAVAGELSAAETDLDRISERYAGAAPEVAACRVVQLVCLRLLAGRGDEILPVIAAAADQNPHIPCYRAVLALTAAEVGDLGLAASALSACAVDEFEVLPDDSNRFLALAVLGDAAATVGSSEQARVLLSLLEPWSGQQVLLNCYGGGGAFWGPADRILGRLAALTGDGRAPEFFAAAALAAQRSGSPWAMARTAADAAAVR